MRITYRSERLMTSVTGLISAIALLTTMYRAAMRPVQWWQNRNSHWVNLDARDPSFEIVLAALEKRFPRVFDRSTLLYVNEHNNRVSVLSSPGDYETHRHYQVKKLFDGDVEVNFILDGHKIGVAYDKADEPMSDRKPNSRPTLRFRANSSAAKHAVEKYLTGIIESHDRSKPTLRMLNSWNDWRVISYAPVRNLDHVILADGKKDAIVADLDRFLRSEDKYALITRPYTRGYLFYGPPGTGKTSMAKALANHFELDVYYLNLADVKSDAALHEAIADVTARSLLVLEDIDSIHAATDREQESNKVTSTGLLNALDGMITPHGLITVITTNHRDTLDEALIRSGRVDMEVEFDVATADQLLAMWASTVGGTPHFSVDNYVGKAPAAFMEEIAKAIDGVTL